LFVSFIRFFFPYPLLIGLTESKKKTARLAEDSKALKTSQSKVSPPPQQLSNDNKEEEEKDIKNIR
jgi:hypothetical protein